MQVLSTALYLGIIGTGACFVGANPAYTYYELHHLLCVSKAGLVVVDTDLTDKLLPAAKACGLADSSVFAFDSKNLKTPNKLRSWSVLL